MPCLLIVQNLLEEDIVVQEGVNGRTSHFLRYQLASSLRFQEPHYARLVHIGGVQLPVLVYTDFVERQHVNGQFSSYLGNSGASSSNTWVPLASNHIPTFGFLQLSLANRGNLGDVESASDKKYTLIIEFGSESWVHGTKGET